MIFRKLIDRRNNHATWLLAIVIFLSGFSFSLSTEYAKSEHVKAKTELVASARTRSKKSISYGQSAFSFAPFSIQPSFSTSYYIHFQNGLYNVLFNEVNKTHRYFFPLLITRHLLSKTPEENLAYLLG
ncbi:MAG TPA: hypothetical protein VIT44_17660 [Cyclobacteriaceae bacterium]